MLYVPEASLLKMWKQIETIVYESTLHKLLLGTKKSSEAAQIA